MPIKFLGLGGAVGVLEGGANFIFMGVGISDCSNIQIS